MQRTSEVECPGARAVGPSRPSSASEVAHKGPADAAPRAGAARRLIWGVAVAVLVAGVAAGGFAARQRVAAALHLKAPSPTRGAVPWSSARAALASATAPPPPPVADPSTPGTALATGGFDLGEPFVVAGPSGYSLFTSQSLPTLHVPVVTAAPKGTWGTEADALPSLPAWTAPGPVTGPAVEQLGGRWVLYFAAPSAATGAPCIGTATAGGPTGPFTATPAPLVCPSVAGGAADPRAYVAPTGTPYLTWVEGASAPGGAAVWGQQLAATGTSLVGVASPLYHPDLPWQQGTVSSAGLLDGGGRTWLVYSAGGGYTSATDAIGMAWCDGPLGPCGDQWSNPLLSSNGQGPGPGDPSVMTANGQTWLVYNPAYSVDGATARSVDAALLGFGSGGPYLATSGLPPAPPASQTTPAVPPPPAPPPAATPAALAATTSAQGPVPAAAGPASGVVDGGGITAVEAAVSQLGVPYVWGGESPGAGFDCSGLTQWAWAQAGVAIPRTAAAQWAALPHVPLSSVQPGDLLFYYNLDGDHQVDHVVMYVGSGPYGADTIIHAPSPGQRVTYAAVWSQGLVGAAQP